MAKTHREVSLSFLQTSGAFAVRVNKGSKSPTNEWDPATNSRERSDELIKDLACTEDGIAGHFHTDLVDVDADPKDNYGTLAAALDALLPPCAHVWGHKLKPRSHRVYRVKEGFDPDQFKGLLTRIQNIPEAATEVRGGPIGRGVYSMLPGSIHPSGNPYEWHDLNAAQTTPSTVSIHQVIKGIRMAGAVAVLAPYWVEGVRQKLAMALAGFLHRAHEIGETLAESNPDTFMLSREECQRVLAVLMQVSGDSSEDRKMRMAAFNKTWEKAANGAPVTAGRTISEISEDKNIVTKLYTLLTDNKDVQRIEYFLSRYVLWQGPAAMIDTHIEGQDGSSPYMSKEAFCNSYGHEWISIGGERKHLPQLMYSMRNTTRVNGMAFDPGKPMIIHSETGAQYNAWKGFEIEPYNGAVKLSDVKPFNDYVQDIVCYGDPEVYDWVIAWVANMFQEPGNKPGTALVLLGLPGAGKSFLGAEVLGKIIGRAHYATSNNIDLVTRNFNADFAKRLLIQCDEATNSRQHGVASRLKSLITDPLMRVEPKGINAYFLPSHARFLITSNSMDNAVFIGEGQADRRYTVLHVSEKRKDDLKEYWLPLLDWLKDPQTLPKILRFLLDIQYDPALIRRPLITEAKVTLQKSSWDPFDAWLSRMVSNDFPLMKRHHKHYFDTYADDKEPTETIDRREWPTHIRYGALADDINEFMNKHPGARGQAPYDAGRLGQVLRGMGLLMQGKPKRITASYWDDRSINKISERVRLNPAPDREKIREHLRVKYGVEFAKEEAFEETVISDTLDY